MRDRGAEGVLSSVSYSEVLSKISDRGISCVDAAPYLQFLLLTEVPFDREQAVVAASLRAPTRALGLSFADRACLALAKSYRLAALTADRGWATADVGVEVILIR